ncbi:hypothetical protein DOY81_005810, partial [Sarcophaga bullata]
QHHQQVFCKFISKTEKAKDIENHIDNTFFFFLVFETILKCFSTLTANNSNNKKSSIQLRKKK